MSRLERDESKRHGNYMELMSYLQQYQDSISHSAAGMLPNKNLRQDPDVKGDDDQTLTAEEIWPRVKSGPNKGQIVPRRDDHGNIVVDPAGNIIKETYLLDYNVYKSLHAQ